MNAIFFYFQHKLKGFLCHSIFQTNKIPESEKKTIKYFQPLNTEVPQIQNVLAKTFYETKKYNSRNLIISKID